MDETAKNSDADELFDNEDDVSSYQTENDIESETSSDSDDISMQRAKKSVSAGNAKKSTVPDASHCIVMADNTRSHCTQFLPELQKSYFVRGTELADIMRNYCDASYSPIFCSRPRGEHFGDDRQYIRYYCVHAGKYEGRVASVAEGPKKQTHSGKKGCRATINWIYVNDEKAYKLGQYNLSHNHEISLQFYCMYQQNRRLDEAQARQVLDWHDKGVASGVSAESLRKETGLQISAKQCRNIVQRNKKVDGDSFDGALSSAIANIMQEDPGCVVDLVTFNDASTQEKLGKLRALTIVSTKMQQAMAERPSILVVDTTYNTNSNRYPMLGLVAVHEETGITVPVAVSFIESEDTKTIKLAMSRIAAIHGDAWNSIKYVLSDRDWPTISGIDFAAAADARIFICRYHLSRAVRNLHKAGSSPVGKSEANKMFWRMIASTTRQNYELAYNNLVNTMGKQQDSDVHAQRLFLFLRTFIFA